jgi:hypothetical protein
VIPFNSEGVVPLFVDNQVVEQIAIESKVFGSRIIVELEIKREIIERSQRQNGEFVFTVDVPFPF